MQLGSADPIDEAIAGWRSFIRQRGRGLIAMSEAAPKSTQERETPFARQLRTMVWEKIEPHITGCSAVILVPDSYLHYVPWTALPGKTRGTYLIEDLAVCVAANGQDLCRILQETSTPSGTLLAVGGVSYDADPTEAIADDKIESETATVPDGCRRSGNKVVTGASCPAPQRKPWPSASSENRLPMPKCFREQKPARTSCVEACRRRGTSTCNARLFRRGIDLRSRCEW